MRCRGLGEGYDYAHYRARLCLHADYFLAAIVFEQFIVKDFYKPLHHVCHGQLVNAVIHTAKSRFGRILFL